MSITPHVDRAGLLDAYRDHGIDIDRQVVVLPGAERRGARAYTSGFNRGVQCVANHHTAERRGTRPQDSVDFIIRGRGAGFVISSTYTDTPDATGLSYARIWLIALWAGTYTEGSGGSLGLIPRSGANRVAFSNEIANDGVGQAYHAAQVDLINRKNAAECSYFGATNDWSHDWFGPSRLFSHHNWTAAAGEPWRKNDPKGRTDSADWSTGGTWDMDRVRRDARNLHALSSLPPEPTPEPDTEEDELMLTWLWKHNDHPELFLICNGSVTHVDGNGRDIAMVQYASKTGNPLPRVDSDNDATYSAYMWSAGHVV